MKRFSLDIKRNLFYWPTSKFEYYLSRIALFISSYWIGSREIEKYISPLNLSTERSHFP